MGRTGSSQRIGLPPPPYCRSARQGVEPSHRKLGLEVHNLDVELKKWRYSVAKSTMSFACDMGKKRPAPLSSAALLRRPTIWIIPPCKK